MINDLTEIIMLSKMSPMIVSWVSSIDLKMSDWRFM